MQCNAMQCNAIQCNTLQYVTIHYNTIQYNTIRYDTIRYDTIRYDTMRYDTIRYDTVQYSTVPHHTSPRHNIPNFYTPEVSFSSSNLNISVFNQVFDGPSNGAMAIYPTFARLTRLLVARFLRIIPQPQDGLRVMRLEIYGCLKEPMPSYPGFELFPTSAY